MKKHSKRLSFLFLALIMSSFVFSCSSISSIPSPVKNKMKRGRVVKVLDGDDVLLENNVRVRLIGIDAPETYPGKKNEPYTEIARTALENLILGKEIYVEYGDERKDVYNRNLVYAYLPESKNLDEMRNVTYNGFLFLNAYLVKMGHAVPRRYSTRNNRYELLLFKQLKDAQQYNRGIWAEKWDEERYRSTN